MTNDQIDILKSLKIPQWLIDLIVLIEPSENPVRPTKFFNNFPDPPIERTYTLIPCPGIWLGIEFSGCLLATDLNGPNDCPTCEGSGRLWARPGWSDIKRV